MFARRRALTIYHRDVKDDFNVDDSRRHDD